MRAFAFARVYRNRIQHPDHLNGKEVAQFCNSGWLSIPLTFTKGGKTREVPVLPGHEEDVLAVIQGRAPNEKVFDHIPKHMDVHSYRRDSAQHRYLHYTAGQALPPVEGRLRREDYDPTATQQVSWALGHNRLDVVLRHYLR